MQQVVTKSAKGANIFGMNWFNTFNLRIADDDQRVQENQIVTPNQHLEKKEFDKKISGLCKKYNTLFEAKLGLCFNFRAQIQLENNARDYFTKSRPIPFA